MLSALIPSHSYPAKKETIYVTAIQEQMAVKKLKKKGCYDVVNVRGSWTGKPFK